MKLRTVWPGASAPGWATRPASTASFAPKVWRTEALGSSIFSSACIAWEVASNWRRDGRARWSWATDTGSIPCTSAAMRRTVWTSRPNRRAISFLGTSPWMERAATASRTPWGTLRFATRPRPLPTRHRCLSLVDISVVGAAVDQCRLWAPLPGGDYPAIHPRQGRATGVGGARAALHRNYAPRQDDCHLLPARMAGRTLGRLPGQLEPLGQ